MTTGHYIRRYYVPKLSPKNDTATWKATETQKSLESLTSKSQQQITYAKSIIIGGAGAVGIEFAGELAGVLRQDGEQYIVSLLSTTIWLLPALKDATVTQAKKILYTD